MCSCFPAASVIFLRSCSACISGGSIAHAVECDKTIVSQDLKTLDTKSQGGS